MGEEKRRAEAGEADPAISPTQPTVDLTKCIECDSPSSRTVRWSTSRGPVHVGFCTAHARAWWKAWKGTPTGDTASFFDPPSAPAP